MSYFKFEAPCTSSSKWLINDLTLFSKLDGLVKNPNKIYSSKYLPFNIHKFKHDTFSLSLCVIKTSLKKIEKSSVISTLDVYQPNSYRKKLNITIRGEIKGKHIYDEKLVGLKVLVRKKKTFVIENCTVCVPMHSSSDDFIKEPLLWGSHLKSSDNNLHKSAVTDPF